MMKKKLVNLEKALRKERGNQSELSKKLHVVASSITRMINCQISIEPYKDQIIDYISSKQYKDISFDTLFTEFTIDDNQIGKPANYDSEFAKRVRFAIDKQKHFSGYKSDKEIIEATGKLISAHTLSDYKNGYYECNGDQLEQLAITLNVIPMYLNQEVNLPYDYSEKELIANSYEALSDSPYESIIDSIDSFISDVFFYAQSIIGFSLDTTKFPKTSFEKYIPCFIMDFLNDLSDETNLSCEEIIHTIGTPETIIQKLNEDWRPTKYSFSDFSEEQQLYYLEKERQLIEWYLLKEDNIVFHDFFIINQIKKENIKSDSIDSAVSRYMDSFEKVLRESQKRIGG